MPYVKSNIRELHKDTVEHFKILHAGKAEAGEINYIISSLCHSVLKKQGVCYNNINMLMGVLEAVKFELYRTIIADYEDTKRLENGVVSALDQSWKKKLR